jgi:phosphoribosylformylglycinamidine synthase
LNFGNPYNPESYWQFTGAIKGMSRACEYFGTPVTGGNVSFYNQASIDGKTESVNPTPVIGMLGLLKNKKNQMTLAFRESGDVIFLLGKPVEDIASSEYLYSYHKITASPVPYFNIEEEYNLHQTLQHLITNKFICSAHDVSDGGLFVTLAESAMPLNLGFDVTTDEKIRKDAFLFGESQGRAVVSVNAKYIEPFIEFMKSQNLPYAKLGTVTESEIIIDEKSFGKISDIKQIYDTAIEKIVENN